jgi:3-oxoacyl-[acyl-carrier protein] reductase
MKKYIVTGAFRGIGLAITERLLKNSDVSVVGIYSSSDEMAANLKVQYGDRLQTIKLDLTNRTAITETVNQLKTEKFNGMVNNAGIISFDPWEGDLQLEHWDSGLQVNLIAPLMFIHGLKDCFVDNASIVNIVSVDAFEAAYSTLAYAVSKAGLVNLTRSLAAIFAGRNIRVNAIAPGWIETGMNIAGVPKTAAQLTPLKRNGTGMDIANLANFLLSDEAGFVNAEIIIADGGLSVIDYTVWEEEQNVSG